MQVYIDGYILLEGVLQICDLSIHKGGQDQRGGTESAQRSPEFASGQPGPHANPQYEAGIDPGGDESRNREPDLRGRAQNLERNITTAATSAALTGGSVAASQKGDVHAWVRTNEMRLTALRVVSARCSQNRGKISAPVKPK